MSRAPTTNLGAINRGPVVSDRGIVNRAGPTGRNYAAGSNWTYHDHDHHGHHHHFGGGTFGLFAFGGPTYYDYYNNSDSCYLPQRVWTPYGWRWRYVYVCY
jgi:hypothetical protein